MIVEKRSGRGTEDSESVLCAGAIRKNRDEFFNFIVRVSSCTFINYQIARCLISKLVFCHWVLEQIHMLVSLFRQIVDNEVCTLCSYPLAVLM